MPATPEPPGPVPTLPVYLAATVARLHGQAQDISSEALRECWGWLLSLCLEPHLTWPRPRRPQVSSFLVPVRLAGGLDLLVEHLGSCLGHDPGRLDRYADLAYVALRFGHARLAELELEEAVRYYRDLCLEEVSASDRAAIVARQQILAAAVTAAAPLCAWIGAGCAGAPPTIKECRICP